MANTIAQLAVKLGLETSEFTQGLNTAKRGLKELGEAAVTASKIAVVAFTAMVYKSLEYSDQMADLSDSTEIGIASILKISNALEQSGGSAENASKILSKFAQTVDQAAQGSKTAQEAFSRVGVSLDDLRKLSMEELFNKTTKGIAAMGQVTERTGSAVEFFSRGIKGVDMVGLSARVQEGSEKFNEYEASIKAAADMHDRLAQKTTMLMLSFTKEVMPTLNAMFDTMSEKGGFAENVFKGLNIALVGTSELFGQISDFSRRIALNWERFVSGTKSSAEYMGAWNDINLEALARQQKLYELLQGKQSAGKPTPPPGSPRNVSPAKDAAVESDLKKQAEMLRVAGLISEEYQRQEQFALKQLISRGQMNAMTEDQRAIQTAVNQALDATSKKIDEITKAREAAAGRGGNAEVLAEYDKQIAKVRELGEAFEISARNFETWQIAQQRTFTYGWNKAFAQYAEDAYNYGKMGEDSFKAVTGSMTNAINTFVETGKLSFKDLASSIIKELIRIQMQQMAMQMFSAGSSLLGSLFSAGMGAATGGASVGGFSGGGVAMAAAGGAIDQPTIVGEQGAELFIPTRSGTIIPHNDMAGAMGGQTINYNGTYVANMSAIDTQSATAFLARNKTAVWAAHQSASRSNPTNR